MTVVADTSPLNYLVLLDIIELLQALYERVLIPQEVHLELRRTQAPQSVRTWASSLPKWCEVRLPLSVSDAALNELDAGERDAIQLALDTGIDTLLMDESEGRRKALRLGLRVIGTLAVLEKTAQLGLIDFRAELQRLEETNFRLSDIVRAEFLKRMP